MGIERIRSSLNSDDLKVFDDIMSNAHLADDVKHDIIGFDNIRNFIIKSTFNTKPNTGLVLIKDGTIANSICY